MTFSSISNINLLYSHFKPYLVTRLISTTASLLYVYNRSLVRVVDNSEIGKKAMLEGRPPRVICVYKTAPRKELPKAEVGQKVLLAIKGEMKKAIVVGLKRKQESFTPRFDSNNVVLIDDKGNPLGNRILVPIPNILRNDQYRLNKLVAIATKFV